MSWLFSQALVAAFSEESCSDGEQSAPSNTTPTPQAFLSRDKTTDAWSRFPSGMMCEPLTADRGEELLTWFRAGFRVRTYRQPAKGRASTENAAECGERWPGSLAKFDRATSSWRTAQFLLFEDSTESLETFPRWGLMRDGEFWALCTPAHLIEENESGFWPTPAATDDHHFCRVTMERKQRGEDRPSGAKIGKCLKWEPRALPYLVAGRIHPNLHEWLMGWPTNWSDCTHAATDKFQQWLRSHGVCLEGQQMTEEAA